MKLLPQKRVHSTDIFFSVELECSQVLLEGTETTGSVIVSAGKANLISSEHDPIWQQRHLKSKTTWAGVLDAMQVCSDKIRSISTLLIGQVAFQIVKNTYPIVWKHLFLRAILY